MAGGSELQGAAARAVGATLQGPVTPGSMDDGPLELLTIGRVSVDLYAEQLGVPIRHVRTFRKSVGGTATNVAVAAARLGHHTAVLTKVGDDPFGDYVRWALAETFGVDTRFVGVAPDAAHAARLRRDGSAGRPAHHLLPRAGGARPEHRARRRRRRRGRDRADPVGRRPAPSSAEPSRSTVHGLLARPWAAGRRRSSTSTGARSCGTPRRAPHASSTSPSARRRSPSATAPSARSPSGTADPDEAADRLLGRGLTGAIVKLGGDGVLVATADDRRRVPAVPVDVVVRARRRRRVRRRGVPRAAVGLAAARVRRATATPPARSSPGA